MAVFLRLNARTADQARKNADGVRSTCGTMGWARGIAGVALVVALGCRTAPPTSSGLREAASDDGSETQRLWDAYVHDETDGKKLLPDCLPRILHAAGDVPFQGSVFFFHGFTACPQQYFSIGAQLNKLGYDVYLPVLPGEGREPFDGPTGDKDNFSELPGWKDHSRYQQFVDRMLAIAKTTRGPRVVAGLSGGGSLAAGAVVFGPGTWERLLLYAPYLKNAGTNGFTSSVINFFNPGYVDDWGASCRANRKRPGGRQGLCSLSVDAIRTMTDYGVMIAKRFGEIQIPTQVTGVEGDPTAHDGAISQAFQSLKNGQICFFKKGVPHSMINPKADAPDVAPYWVPALEANSIAFITKGEWFKTDGLSSEHNRPRCSAAAPEPSNAPASSVLPSQEQAPP